jgi:hypothetical protein
MCFSLFFGYKLPKSSPVEKKHNISMTFKDDRKGNRIDDIPHSMYLLVLKLSFLRSIKNLT